MTLLSCDVAQQVYALLHDDLTLKAIQGLEVSLVKDSGALKATADVGVNQRIIVRKERCGASNWNAGGLVLHNQEFVTVEIICRSLVKAKTDARTFLNTLRSRIKELMFSYQPLGVGWLDHKEVGDRFPTPPTKVYAYNSITYQVRTTTGNV